MSLFAGIFSINSNQQITNDTREVVRKAIESGKGKVAIFSNSHFFLAKLDFGAFGESGYFYDEKKGVATIAGEPFVKNANQGSYSRFSDLCELSEHLSKGKLDILSRCNGSYSICCYNPDKHSLFLATDKLGIRPVYYYYDDNFLYFSSCLKFLELIEKIPKRADLKALVEEYVFGIALGNKTRYYEIKLLRDGQYMQCKNEDLKISFYFRWDKISTEQKNIKSALKECYDAFRSAVSIRSSHDDKAFALLSGGLDSRCVVSILHALGKEIIVLNSFLPGQPDQVFSMQYAKRLGIDLIATQRSPDRVWTERILLEAIEDARMKRKEMRNACLVFSGDGGSFGVGHIYLDEKLLDLLNEGKIDKAIHYFLKDRNMPQKIIKSSMLPKLKNIPFDSIKEEIEDVAGVAPGRAFYLFLLRNDQRRHMHAYYENIDQSGVELLLPFFDARLIEVIVRAPLEPFLNHGFYHKWLDLFPAHTRSVPWQTYPGHLPCPLPGAEKYPSQWQTTRKDQFRASRSSLERCLKVLGKRDFPGKLINRARVLFAILLHSMKIKNYSYIFDFCLIVYDQYSKSKSLTLDLDDMNNLDL